MIEVVVLVLRGVVVVRSWSEVMGWSNWFVRARFPPTHLPLRAAKTTVAILTLFPTKAHLASHITAITHSPPTHTLIKVFRSFLSRSLATRPRFELGLSDRATLEVELQCKNRRRLSSSTAHRRAQLLLFLHWAFPFPFRFSVSPFCFPFAFLRFLFSSLF